MKIRNISLPIQLIAVIVFTLVFGKLLPLSIVQASYTFSELFKELLGLILPFMVFFFVVAGILSFKKNAPVVLGVLLSSIFLSNGLVVLFSYSIMSLFRAPTLCESVGLPFVPECSVQSLVSLSLSLPFSVVHALIAAILVGLTGIFIGIPYLETMVNTAKGWIESILNRIFIPFLPLYVFGFLLKMRCEGMLVCVMQQYGSTFVLIIGLQTIYIIWLYFLANNFSIKDTSITIRNAMPSYLAAFSTMSSTATVPIAIKSAKENTGNASLSNMAMPILANVHLLGDCIGTPILAITTMQLFLGIFPGVEQYFAFAFYFGITMFAASGIPGGGILVMIPILITQLGFTPEMISIITTLYFLLDPFGTAANVMGDGALVIIVNKFLKRLGIA